MELRRGIGVGEGVAWGPAFVYRPRAADAAAEARAADRTAATGEEARAAFAQAREAAARGLQAVRERVARSAGEEAAAIFDAHLLMLRDPMLERSVSERLSQGQRLGGALQAAVEELAGRLAAIDDPLLRQRAEDVRDVGGRLLRAVAGVPPVSPLEGLASDAIVVAADLAPSDTASLPRGHVLALVTEGGGATSHSAILARSMGIPAVVALGSGLLDRLGEASSPGEGVSLAVDAAAGLLYIEPDQATLGSLRDRAERSRRLSERRRALSGLPAETADGFRVELAANIGGPADTEAALAGGAEGVGLFRTEFLFLGRSLPPSEEEQVAAYREVLERMGERPVIFRTLDVGGDKPLPFLAMPPEPNPFLGQRAIRLMEHHPEVFGTQLRAIMRAGWNRTTPAGAPQTRIMFPMVGTLEDVRACREAFQQAWDAVSEHMRPGGRRGGAGTAGLRPLLGIMVEIPAAALLMDRMAAEIDFASLGTNDLAQYTMAADRTNPRVAVQADPLNPAVLRLMVGAIRACRAAGTWIGVCGEAGGDPAGVAFFVAAGVDELSMSPGRLPEAREQVRGLRRQDLQGPLARALDAASADEARRQLTGAPALSPGD